jgi:hypothetical protein
MSFDEWFELTPAMRYRVRPKVAYGLHDYKCGAETAMGTYLADKEVMKAIHVRPGVGGMMYTRTVDDLRPVYKCGPRNHHRSAGLWKGYSWAMRHECALNVSV